MRTREEFQTLILSLVGDQEELTEVASSNAQALLRMKAGAEEVLDSTDTGHQELLERMKLDLAPLRPALIEDVGLYEALQELRGFRHVFRHHYGVKLKKAKLLIVQTAFDEVMVGFLLAHERFVTRLRAISEALE